jgi:uncharacterized membrane protein YeaQ/YmgE (transglycosylase-associated protein family)
VRGADFFAQLGQVLIDVPWGKEYRCRRLPAARHLWRNGKVGILSWILVGLVAGFLAKYAVPGEGPGGIVGDVIIGIVGAFIGGFIFNAFGHFGVTGLNVYSILVAFIGAVVLLFIMRAISGRRTV